MLPQDFSWRDDDDGATLLLWSTPVARYVELENGRYRLGLRIYATPGYKFLDCRDPSRRYCEAWATKWEERIREEVGRQRASYQQAAAELAARPRTEPIQTTHRRHRRH